MRSKNQTMLVRELGDSIDRRKELKIRVEVDRCVNAAPQKVSKEPRFERSGELHD
jgi:hypothetical protein